MSSLESPWVQGAPLTSSRRQLACFQLKAPPAELKDVMDGETFEKARRYGRDKTRYSLSKCIFDQVLSWGLIRMGVYSKMWEYAGKGMDAVGLSQSRTVSSASGNACTGFTECRSPTA